MFYRCLSVNRGVPQSLIPDTFQGVPLACHWSSLKSCSRSCMGRLQPGQGTLWTGQGVPPDRMGVPPGHDRYPPPAMRASAAKSRVVSAPCGHAGGLPCLFSRRLQARRLVEELQRNSKIEISITFFCVGKLLFIFLFQLSEPQHQFAQISSHFWAQNSQSIICSFWNLATARQFIKVR